MHDTIVIGGGLFGQVIAAGLRDIGHEVIVLDNREPLAGSGPAACLMKPSWFAGLGKSVHVPSLELLDRLYGVRDLPFDVAVGKTGKIAETTVHWCDPKKILARPTVRETVAAVMPGRVTLAPSQGEGAMILEARNIIVAAGIWTQRLMPEYRQAGQRGMATLFPREHPERGHIQLWAPYRQLVGFNRGDGLWIGDGTSIKMENWTPAREEEVSARELSFARKAFGDPLGVGNAHSRLHGIRPYYKGRGPCLLEELRPGLWVASGGAKNGTIAAGWCAHKLREALA